MGGVSRIVEVRRCLKCGEPLKVFAAYLPGVGEVCMGCYVKAARESEKLAIIR
jgi:NMD protein affecting ribosome stability and mRNA decay